MDYICHSHLHSSRFLFGEQNFSFPLREKMFFLSVKLGQICTQPYHTSDCFKICVRRIRQSSRSLRTRDADRFTEKHKEEKSLRLSHPARATWRTDYLILSKVLTAASHPAVLFRYFNWVFLLLFCFTPCKIWPLCMCASVCTMHVIMCTYVCEVVYMFGS